MRFEKETLKPEFQPVALTVVFETAKELKGFVTFSSICEAAILDGLRAQGNDHLLEKDDGTTAPKQSSNESLTGPT